MTYFGCRISFNHDRIFEHRLSTRENPLGGERKGGTKYWMGKKSRGRGEAKEGRGRSDKENLSGWKERKW